MKCFHRSNRTTDAEGFAVTDSVSAKFRKEGADRFILLRNGVNLFRFDPRQYVRISVERAGEGYNLLGYLALSRTESTVLASFTSARAAENAHAAVAAAYAGLRGKRNVLRWVLIGAVVYAVGSFLFGSPKAVGAPALAVGAGASAQMEQTLPDVALGQAPDAANLSRGAPTLDDLAAGKYQFNPKIAAPDVQAPDLNCAAK